MCIQKIVVKVREETTSKIYDVEITTEDLLKAIQGAKSTEYLWLYISGWLKATNHKD